jgi:hypothetical protein
MPRSIIDDFLLSSNFHLIDVDFSMSIPPFVLMPSMGFSSISSPEITVESEEIVEGTDNFVHHTMGKSSMSPIILQRGVNAFNSDFWRWIMACVRGDPPEPPSLTSLVPGQVPPIPGKRRDLLLLHLTDISFEGIQMALGNISGMSVSSVVKAVKGGSLLAAGAAVEAANFALGLTTGGLVDLGIWAIPGKAYLLYDCIPLEILPHRIEELSVLG